MSENSEKTSESKTFGREVSTGLLIFLCWLTYTGKAEVSDWITPMTVFLTVAFGSKQDAIKKLVER